MHPKAAKARADADTGAAHAASGIDYLRLIQTRHQDAMTAQPITFTAMTRPDPSDQEVAR